MMLSEFKMTDAMTTLMRLKTDLAAVAKESGFDPEESALMQLSLDLGRFALDQIRQRDPVSDPPMDGQKILVWSKYGHTDELVYEDGKYQAICADGEVWDTVPASDIVCWMQMPTKPSRLQEDQ